jgi:hypothetical protein
MQKQELLIAEKATCRSMLIGLQRRIDALRQELYHLEEMEVEAKHSYARVDRELALVDGRHKVITLSKKKKEPKQPKLTKEQVRRLAKQFGVEIDI